MDTPRLKIYLAHALTKASDEYKASLWDFRRYIEEKHPEWEILSFYGIGESPTDGKVAEHDVVQVMKAHLVVAFVDVDSTGMGMESGIRFALGLPILFVAQNDWVRTRMVTGPAELWPRHAVYTRCHNLEGVEEDIRTALGYFKIDPAKELPEMLSVAPHFQELYRTKVLGLPASGWRS